jgi:hypothetical protein
MVSLLRLFAVFPTSGESFAVARRPPKIARSLPASLFRCHGKRDNEQSSPRRDRSPAKGPCRLGTRLVAARQVRVHHRRFPYHRSSSSLSLRPLPLLRQAKCRRSESLANIQPPTPLTQTWGLGADFLRPCRAKRQAMTGLAFEGVACGRPARSFVDVCNLKCQLLQSCVARSRESDAASHCYSEQEHKHDRTVDDNCGWSRVRKLDESGRVSVWPVGVKCCIHEIGWKTFHRDHASQNMTTINCVVFAVAQREAHTVSVRVASIQTESCSVGPPIVVTTLIEGLQAVSPFEMSRADDQFGTVPPCATQARAWPLS